MSPADILQNFAAYLNREAARRAKGQHPGVVKLRDDEIAALLQLLRRESPITSGAEVSQ